MYIKISENNNILKLLYSLEFKKKKLTQQALVKTGNCKTLLSLSFTILKEKRVLHLIFQAMSGIPWSQVAWMSDVVL